MEKEKLIKELFNFGNIEFVKEDYVFSVLITGSNLANFNNICKIKTLIRDYLGNKYPDVEIIKNDDSFFCMILKDNYELQQQKDLPIRIQRSETF